MFDNLRDFAMSSSEVKKFKPDIIFDDYIRDIDDPIINNVMLDYVRERIQYEIPYYQGGSKKKTVKKSKKTKKVKKKRVKRVKRIKRGGNRFLKSNSLYNWPIYRKLLTYLRYYLISYLIRTTFIKYCSIEKIFEILKNDFIVNYPK